MELDIYFGKVPISKKDSYSITEELIFRLNTRKFYNEKITHTQEMWHCYLLNIIHICSSYYLFVKQKNNYIVYYIESLNRDQRDIIMNLSPTTSKKFTIANSKFTEFFTFFHEDSI